MELDLSHPEDFFADSEELDWIQEDELPGGIEERLAEDKSKEDKAPEKKRKRKDKKEESKKTKKDKKDKKEKKEAKEAKGKKEPVVFWLKHVDLKPVQQRDYAPTRTMRSALCDAGRNRPRHTSASPLDLDPSSDTPTECPVEVATSPVGHNDPERFQANLEALVEEQAGESCPPAGASQSVGTVELDLSHPEDFFADSEELDWIQEDELPGGLEDRVAEDKSKEDKAPEKKWKRKDKKEESKKTKKDKKDKKEKKEAKEAKGKKKKPVVVPARCVTLAKIREELEHYCSLMELSSDSDHAEPWQSDPLLQRAAIVSALANALGCSYVAFTAWKQHILCWVDFRRAEGNRFPTSTPAQKASRKKDQAETKKREAEAKRQAKAKKIAMDKRNRVKREARLRETAEQALTRKQKETESRRERRQKADELQQKVRQAREVRNLDTKPGKLTPQELRFARTEVERWCVECRVRGEPQEEALWRQTSAGPYSSLDVKALRTIFLLAGAAGLLRKTPPVTKWHAQIEFLTSKTVLSRADQNLRKKGEI